VKEAILEDDLDNDDELLEEDEAVLVEDLVVVPSMEDDHNYVLNDWKATIKKGRYC